MAHVATDRKLLHRVRRLKGQVAAIEKTIENGDCSRTLQLIAATRGAMTALLVEVLESHIKEHILDRDHGRPRATEELMAVLRSYVR